MTEILNKIVNHEITTKILDWTHRQEFVSRIYDLGSTEIYVIAGVAAVLLLVIAYRRFGMIMVFILLVFYLIFYTLYINDIFGSYEKHEKNKDEHMKIIEEELEKGG